MAYFLATTAILAALLFYPASRLIWVLSVRRLERRTQRRLSEAEQQGQLRRARFIAFLVAVLFAVLFNYNLIGIPGDGN